MTPEIYNQAIAWKNEYIKRPYSVTNKQIVELDVMLIALNKPKTRDRSCGICVKQSVEVLLNEIKIYEQNLEQDQPKQICPYCGKTEPCDNTSYPEGCFLANILAEQKTIDEPIKEQKPKRTKKK